MTRIGPNQDINDPATIVNLTNQFQQVSNNMGDLLAQFNAQDPNISGSPIVDVSTPLKMADGSTQLLRGNNIESDTSLIPNATIVTYVNLAERFRDYWEILNDILDELGDYDYIQQSGIDPEGPVVFAYNNGIMTSGSVSGIGYIQESYSHLPSESLSVPLWTGIGPTNYNQLTYPQLLNELIEISGQASGLVVSWDTTYLYEQYSRFYERDSGGYLINASAFFGLWAFYGSPLSQQYVQIHNSGSNAINITLSIDITTTFDITFTATYASWAEIGDVNSYPIIPGDDISNFPSYVEYSEDLFGGGTIVLSTTRVIEIPPNKSAFIGCGANAGVNPITPPTIAEADITVVLNGQTLTYSIELI